MRRNWIAVLCLGLAIIFLVGLAQAQNRIKRVAQSTSTQSAGSEQAKQVKFTGKVVDTNGQPISGAKATLFNEEYGQSRYSFDISDVLETTTNTEGAFSFRMNTESDGYPYGYLVVEKQGAALDCTAWDMREDKEFEFKLRQAEELIGVVVDENGEPVSGAEVSILILIAGKEKEQRSLSINVAPKLLTASTDRAGKFSFNNLSADATVEFLVKKTGRVTISTFEPVTYRRESLQFSPGQTDIRITQPTEARIEGIVVDKDSGQPVAEVKLMVRKGRNQRLYGQDVITSRKDGTFSVPALPAGSYLLQFATPREGLADWAAEPVNVTLKAGQAKTDVRIELSKGGFLEVLVTEAVSKQPVEKASVSFRDARSYQWLSAISDEDGTARVRLMPGGYQISRVYKQGFTSKIRQETITIEDGKTKHIEWQLTSLPKITGVVRDEAGKPIEGVKLRVCPMGGREDAISDAEGKFEVSWDPERWGERETIYCLVVRHEQRNLAAVEEIGEDTKRLDIKLKSGVIFAGKVVDPDGKGIANAKIVIMLRERGWGSSIERDIVKTDAEGNFKVKAIPAERRYSIDASADGYGGNSIEVQADDAVDNHLDVETLTLAAANLSVSGQIVNTQGNPVPHARVEGSGEDQPHPNTLSDMQGNFTLDGLCAGLVYIRVDVDRSGKRLSARVHTDAGATGIKIVVREGRPVSYYIGAKTYEQIIQGSDKVIAGMAVDENGSPVADVPVKVCCIKREREKGKFSWSYSSYSTLSDITDEQGRFAIELEEDAEYNLRFSPDNHAAVIAYDVPVGKKDLKVTLPDGGTVIGRLVRVEKSKKVPIPNAEVKAEQTSRASYTHLGFDRDRTNVTDSQGRFRFEHLRTKIRPSENRTAKQWEHTPRVWKISYGDTSKTIAFYDGTTIEDLELLVRPDIANAPPLAGRPLPELEDLKIKLLPVDADDKMLLVCFWDMEQRPSRACIRQLAKQNEQLKQKGVTVIAVQVSKVDEDTLNEWVKSYNIPFPIGMVQGDEEETRFAWGVRSLPWLILTNRKHIVNANGFSLSELAEKIQAAEK